MGREGTRGEGEEGVDQQIGLALGEETRDEKGSRREGEGDERKPSE
jgi:hypothetical protein